MASDRLTAAADLVNVLDASGRIIANPQRNAPAATAAEVLALAHATERFWEIALEADLLARAIAMPADAAGIDPLRGLAIEEQAARVSQLMAAIRGETNDQEKSDGSRHS